MLGARKRHAAWSAAVVVALSVGGIGVAYGSSHPSAHSAKAKGKRHVLSLDYKTDAVQVGNTTPAAAEFFDDAKLGGSPLRGKKAQVNEVTDVTYTSPNHPQDASGTSHTTFKADVFPGGTFRGFYDFTADSNGQPTGPINGVITGGSGTFRRATGSFQILNRVVVRKGDGFGYTGRWQGSIRY